MRILALAIFGAISISPAAPQTYDTGYPVCLRAHGNYECSYTTLTQCNASASGRAAQCFINPFFASAEEPAGNRRHRRGY
jgi:hypothetical protein